MVCAPRPWPPLRAPQGWSQERPRQQQHARGMQAPPRVPRAPPRTVSPRPPSKLELIQSHMAQKPMLRGEVGCACVAREVSALLVALRHRRMSWTSRWKHLGTSVNRPYLKRTEAGSGALSTNVSTGPRRLLTSITGPAKVRCSHSNPTVNWTGQLEQ